MGSHFDSHGRIARSIVVLVLAFAAAPARAGLAKSVGEGGAGRPEQATTTYLRDLTFGFVPNDGQWQTTARYVGTASGIVVRAEVDGFWLEGFARSHGDDTVSRAVLRISFEGDRDIAPRSEGSLVGSRNYMYGKDAARWRSGLTAYSSIVWPGVRDGVDYVLGYGSSGASLEYSMRCRAGTGERPLALRLQGADALVIQADGGLVARTAVGELRQAAPRAWELEPSGQHREVPARFVLLDAERFTIEVPGRDSARELFIDPGIEWAGYIGGNWSDLPKGLTLTNADEPVVAGRALSFDFPTTPGVVQHFDPLQYDAFAMKVSADGTHLVFATFLGGSGVDWGWDVEVRPNDAVVVVGQTLSMDFPTTPGAVDAQIAGRDGFVLELRPDGSAFNFSTFLGGSGDERAKGVALHTDGTIAVAGETGSADFPGTTLGFQRAYGGGTEDQFVARMAADGSSIVNATYLGGTGREVLTDLALHDDGSTIVVGWSAYGGFPVTPGAYDTTYSSQAYSSVIARFDATLSNLVFASYLDGSSGSQIWATDTTPSGDVAVVGTTGSSDFPTTSGAYDTSSNSSANGFVSVLTADGSSLAFSSFDGAGFASNGYAIHVDSAGVITFGGAAWSDPFPTTPGAFDHTVGAYPAIDAYVVRFKPDGSGLLYSTVMGEQGLEESVRLTLDSQGRVIVIGSVASDSFPVTPGSFDETFGGDDRGGFSEGFLAKVELQPEGVSGFGTPTPACNGSIRLTALHVPKVGNGAFGFACTGAPPGAVGMLGLSRKPLPGGIPMFGVLVYLDEPLIFIGAFADGQGYAEIPLPIPPAAPAAADFQFCAQAFWLDTGGCGGTMALSASDALQVQVTALMKLHFLQ